MFLPYVNNSLVQVCLPKIIGQNRMIWKFLPSAIKSFEQVCLPKSNGQNCLIN